MTYKCKLSEQKSNMTRILIPTVQNCTSEVKSLTVGVLYSLRTGHPAIDGVGVFNIGGNCDMLVTVYADIGKGLFLSSKIT